MKARIFIALLAASFPAYAADGVVTVTLKFYQNQGNYCPTLSVPSRDCGATTYKENDYNVDLPVEGTKMYLYLAGTQFRIGSGVTDVNGTANIAWYHDLQGYQGTDVVINWRYEQKDNRFAVRTITGNTYSSSTAPFTIFEGTSQSKKYGTVVFGSSGSPNQLANVYDGATRMWEDSLSSSNRMDSYFTNVEIRAFEPNDPLLADCQTSCAVGSTKTIRLDAGAAYKPQARVMHEMGHIASYLSHGSQERTVATNYNWPATTGNGGWSTNTPEWSLSAFEEGYATFLGDRAFYFAQNTNPYSCNANGYCTLATDRTEPSDPCTANQNRWPVSVMRYLRDTYDNSQDYPGETTVIPFYEHIEALSQLGSGTGNLGKNEPWNANFTAVDDLDGRSTEDFETGLEVETGISTNTIRNNNCPQPGD